MAELSCGNQKAETKVSPELFFFLELNIFFQIQKNIFFLAEFSLLYLFNTQED